MTERERRGRRCNDRGRGGRGGAMIERERRGRRCNDREGEEAQ